MALTDTENRSIRAISTKFQITLSGTVRMGDLIGYSSGWKTALALTGSTVPARFIALQRGVSGEVIEVTPACMIEGFTAATINGEVYVSKADPPRGKYTQIKPSTSGDIDTVIGYAISLTELYVNPTMRADSTVA